MSLVLHAETLASASATRNDILTELERRKGGRFQTIFPEEGPFRRELYPRHLSFFAAGAEHRERAFIAGNRCGKTVAGVYEDVCHLTGRYPHWWVGRRFHKPIDAWVAGDTGKTTRDILQPAFLGPVGQPGLQGTGMLPLETIIGTTPKAGIPDAVETIYVRHVTGGRSVVTFKSFDQRREAFQGTRKNLIHLDEESDESIYTECLLRTMETGSDFEGGIIICTLTPLQGMTPFILSFVPGGQPPS